MPLGLCIKQAKNMIDGGESSFILEFCCWLS
jgi:hypothetical protein